MRIDTYIYIYIYTHTHPVFTIFLLLSILLFSFLHMSFQMQTLWSGFDNKTLSTRSLWGATTRKAASSLTWFVLSLVSHYAPMCQSTDRTIHWHWYARFFAEGVLVHPKEDNGKMVTQWEQWIIPRSCYSTLQRCPTKENHVRPAEQHMSYRQKMRRPL